MKHRFPKTTPLLPVEGEPKVGTKYHVSWGYSRGVIGVCIAVDLYSKTVVLAAPKTRSIFARPVAWADLRHTRSAQVKIQRENKTKS